MANFENQKEGVGSIWGGNITETSWQDLEPLVTPEQLKVLHLFGVPLVSAIRNPTTGRPDVLQDADLKRYILEAASLAEAEIGGGDFHLFPRAFSERQAYDQKAMDAFGYFELRHRPVSAITKIAVQSADGVNVWTIPNDWVEVGYLHRGQVHIMPFAVSATSGVTLPIASPIGAGLLPSLFRFHWIPALWVVEGWTGWKDALIPKVVNQLVGVIAAMEILSSLAVTYARSQSSSLGIDGLSQSVTTPGPELFRIRLEELAAKRKWLIKKIQRGVGLGMFTSNL